MFDSNPNKFNPDTLYSFLPKNKRLKLSKQGINFISNANMANNPQNNNFLIINGINSSNNNNNKQMNSIKNFNSTNYKWNYNYATNSNSNTNQNSLLNNQKFTGFSYTGTNFYKAKASQSSYNRKFRVNNGYKLKTSSQKKNLKMSSKNSIVENKIPERVRSVRGGSSLEQKNMLNNRIIEHFFNQYETNVKKVLYEMGVVGNIKDKSRIPLSKSNNTNLRNFGNKNYSSKKTNDKNNLPFLNAQNQPNNEPKKIYEFSNMNPGSETNIININNFINFYSDANNNLGYSTNINNLNNNNMNNNNNHLNHIYGTLTNTTLTNNLATNSTNSNIGNNNIIFGTSNISKKNSFNNFSFNTNNFKSKSRSINSYNNTFRNDLNQINSGNSKQIVFDNILSSDSKAKNQDINTINSLHKNEIIAPFSENGQKKARAVSTAPHQFKINFVKEKEKEKITITTKKKEINSNMNIGNNNNNGNVNISSSIYNSKVTINANQVKNKNDKLSKYEIGHTLGKGAYAKVKVVTNLLTQEKCAMKIYDKDKLNDTSKRKCVYREIEILKRINHRNIAKLIEVITTQNHILIVQELVNGISLRDYYNREIRNQKGISEHKANIFKKIFKQIFDAMNYLHKNNMAHRDIKLENILMTREYEIKIIDFGFGMYNPENKLQNFFCGTPNYMPPEIAFKKPYVGQKADLWSLGVLVYKMYCADFPFKGKNEKELYKAIKKGKFSMASYTPDYIKKIIVGMIDLDPNKRLTCENVLRSSWLRD